MKFIFLYGPPAVGKYTIGQELARQTGYKFVHNHVTVDVARLLFDKKDDTNRAYIMELKDALRLDIVRVAAKANVNLIVTLAYTAGESDAFVKEMFDAVTRSGGDVCAVRLTAPKQALYERLGNDSRKQMGKPTDPIALEKKLQKGGLDQPLRDWESLEINTAALTPEQSAKRIIEAFAL